MPKQNLRRVDWKHIAFRGEYDQTKKEQIINKFRDGTIKTEKLASSADDMRFAFRLNDKERAICTNKKYNDQDCLVILSIDEEHKYDKTPGMRQEASAGLAAMLRGYFSPTEKKNTDSLSELGVLGAQSADGNIIVYSAEQATAVRTIDDLQIDDLQNPKVSNIEYFIVNGLAGSGKTTVAFDVLSDARKQGAEAIYVTKSKGLVSQAKKELITPSEGANALKPIKCLTYEQLISEKLFQYFAEFADTVLKVVDPKSKATATPQEQNITTMLRHAKESGNMEALKLELMKLHIDQDQEPHTLMSQCLDAYLKATLSQKEDFVQWLSSSKNKEIKGLKTKLPEGMSLDELYFEIQKTHIALGKKSTLYQSLYEGGTESIASKMSKKYMDYLSSNKKVDPAFVSIKSYEAAAAAQAS